MLGLAFHSVVEYLTKLENSLEDWHLALIRGHTQINKQFLFSLVDLAMLELQGINSVSHLFDTHLSGRIDKSVMLDLLLWLQPYPRLEHKIKLFIKKFIYAKTLS
jgi:hypothetical protein